MLLAKILTGGRYEKSIELMDLADPKGKYV